MKRKLRERPNPKINGNSLLTYKTWEEFHETMGHSGMIGYIMATEHIVRRLDDMLQKEKNFEELKQELTSLINGRVRFHSHLTKEFGDGMYPSHLL